MVAKVDWVAVASGYYYATVHFVATIGTLIWLYRRHPELYRRARRVRAVASFSALIGYRFFPAAPPRLVDPHLTDILVTHNIFGVAHAAKSGGFVNIYAAMPSLHVGWAFWVAAAITRTSTARWRHAAWLYPVTTTLVVLGTANHYVLDTASGAAIVLVAALVVRLSPAVAAKLAES